MDPREIRQALIARPFVPFRVVLNDGKAYDVLDPSDANVDTHLVYIGVDFDEDGLPHKTVRVTPNVVMRLEPWSTPKQN